MRRSLSLLVLFTFVPVALAGEPVKSGPQVGDKVGPFHAFNVTGESAGEKACLFCRFGPSPVAAVFAREATPEVTRLLKKIEAATDKYRNEELGSYALFCSDDTSLKTRLADLARKENLKNILIALDEPAGPEEYKIAKAANVTVILYVDGAVKANHSFRARELDDKAIATILADLPKILPAKK